MSLSSVHFNNLRKTLYCVGDVDFDLMRVAAPWPTDLPKKVQYFAVPAQRLITHTDGRGGGVVG